MTPCGNDNPFAEYLERMRELEIALKEVAQATLDCAKFTEQAANFTLLAVYHVREALKK